MDQPRTVLYVVWLHSFAQLATGMLAAGMVAGLLGALLQAVRAGEAAKAAPALAEMALFAAVVLVIVVRTVFGLYRVEGDRTGLAARRFGRTLSVPWSEVIMVDRPWWGLNLATPVVRVCARGGASLCFLAGPAERERLDALRRAAISSSRADTAVG